MWRLYVENGGTINCNVAPDENYDVSAMLDGEPLEVAVGDNEYTNILEGYNVVFVHMESIQSFLMDLSFNDERRSPSPKPRKNQSYLFL